MRNSIYESRRMTTHEIRLQYPIPCTTTSYTTHKRKRERQKRKTGKRERQRRASVWQACGATALVVAGALR